MTMTQRMGEMDCGLALTIFLFMPYLHEPVAKYIAACSLNDILCNIVLEVLYYID